MSRRPPSTIYVVRPAQRDDRNFVSDSWRRSLQDQPAYSAMPTRGYVAWINAVMAHFVGSSHDGLALRPGIRIYTARDVERPAFLYGWLLCRDTEPGLALVYLYTRNGYRRQGIASDLLAHALEDGSDGPLTYAFHTRVDRWLEQLGLTYQPVEHHERSAAAQGAA